MALLSDILTMLRDAAGVTAPAVGKPHGRRQGDQYGVTAASVSEAPG
jgi:hypothetical protein